jgi:hypothetical protein
LNYGSSPNLIADSSKVSPLEKKIINPIKPEKAKFGAAFIAYSAKLKRKKGDPPCIRKSRFKLKIYSPASCYNLKAKKLFIHNVSG